MRERDSSSGIYLHLDRLSIQLQSHLIGTWGVATIPVYCLDKIFPKWNIDTVIRTDEICLPMINTYTLFGLPPSPG